ncbi:Putative protease [hydrothermal vent metagenome]|uniref:Protease n=1 Tax=hydrothermal vent metagenome TaxID=652676 RepID=A0A3B1ABT3_9ZZZZ
MTIKFPVQYTVTLKNLEAHLFEVYCIIHTPNTEGQIISLPNWIPGSYMIRDFAKNITVITATNDTGVVTLQKINKNTWQCEPSTTAITIKYTVYAFELSVRSAHLDSSHAFFNGTSIFLMAHGFENTSCSVKLVQPSDIKYKDWQVATTLSNSNPTKYLFGTYQASNYDDLIDHPVEMGKFSIIEFSPHDIKHEMIITGRHNTNEKLLAEHLTKICNTHIKMFGEFSKINRYLFLTTVLNNGYGGLEHRSSTSLICSRKDLVNTSNSEISKEYRQFLALCSHEYFHTWNVKRIKPSAYLPYDLNHEVYTQQLWAFEGITSYYDELALVRSGIISSESYLELLSQTITRVWRQYGRLTQSVADSSFDAWTKFYKQDENAPNAIVSYYTKGTLIALALDLTIRAQSNNQLSLDNVMRHLWLEYGKKNIGLKEREIESVIHKITNIDFSDFFNHYLYGTEDLPLTDLFQLLGITINFRAAENQLDLGGHEVKAHNLNKVAFGIRTKLSNNLMTIQHIINDSCAQLAGLSAGDEIISIDGIKVTNNLNELLSDYKVGDEVEIFAFRRDELQKFSVKLQAAPLDTCELSFNKNSSSEQKTFCQLWLHSNL